MAVWMRYANRRRSTSKSSHDYTKVNYSFYLRIKIKANNILQ